MVESTIDKITFYSELATKSSALYTVVSHLYYSRKMSATQTRYSSVGIDSLTTQNAVTLCRTEDRRRSVSCSRRSRISCGIRSLKGSHSALRLADKRSTFSHEYTVLFFWHPVSFLAPILSSLV
ncbi:hypothetical protein CHS0354_042520 [Potamilus streckersoni]|uniref:Uncharacterized protein n=1 Tax=Potamilus streckersoni TaxID=2493646 RepID=A0AAE0TF27_9BIVA|nr:hypothetical protein CHS0354_042520 [Potamilus streckersoni]